MNEQFVLVRGNPFDGMTLTGPFDSHYAAMEYVEEFADGDWLIVVLSAPAGEQNVDDR